MRTINSLIEHVRGEIEILMNSIILAEGAKNFLILASEISEADTLYGAINDVEAHIRKIGREVPTDDVKKHFGKFIPSIPLFFQYIIGAGVISEACENKIKNVLKKVSIQIDAVIESKETTKKQRNDWKKKDKRLMKLYLILFKHLKDDLALRY